MKKLICIILSIVLVFTLAACMSEGEYLESEIQALREQKNTLASEIDALETEKTQLQQEIVDIKVESGMAKYVLTINIKQTHFTLDLGQHLKDSMNDISIQIPVDKEYYDSVNIDFSDAFELAVEEKMIAEQAKLKADYENDTKIAKAEAEAAAKLKEAQAEIDIAIARAEALKIAAEAEAAANKIIDESITDKIIEKLLADAWDGKLPVVVGNGDYILPSDILS